ncbi:MAG: carbon monoxide dehydrogenase subunit G [Rhodobiaceae bacterium]|nr:carbon monoxide dehydrogenase subunit G [Rhodobiaceae bacterium]
MQMNDEIEIAAPRLSVFEALSDPDVLKACIPGCESLEKTSANEMAATVMAKVGPVRARFNGAVQLSDVNPPESYTISGEGRGGAAGFAKGSARVHLLEQGGHTLLRYEVKADVGGKLAQLGSRLIDAAARSYAKDFFAAFKARVEGAAAPAGGGEAAAPEAAPPASRAGGAANFRLWLVLAAAMAAAILAYALN